MKKIPTLFKREFDSRGRLVAVFDEITPGCEEAFYYGKATIKIDGSCCAIIDGEFYKRYGAKKGKKPPEGAIPCCEPDPITGHHPHWVKVNREDPADKWFVEAYNNCKFELTDGTYEAIGKHFNGNPYAVTRDWLVRHGNQDICIDRDFESIKKFLSEYEIEGLVFWLNDEPVCKIKRTDFGLKWPLEYDDEARV